MRLPPIAVKIINAVFLLAVLGFLAAYLVSVDWQSILQAKIDAFSLVASLFPALAALFLMALTWTRALHRMNPKVRFSKALLGVYSKAWLGRYLPGKITWLAGKMHFASRLGIPVAQLGVSSVLELGVQLVAQSSVALILILVSGYSSALPAQLEVLLLPALLLGLIVLLPPVFNRLMGIVFKLLKKQQTANIGLSTAALLEMAALYIMAFLGQALGYALVISAVAGPLPLPEMVFAVATVGLSVLAGILAVFAPGGIGICDGLAALMLTSIISAELAVLCALLLRLQSLVSDLLFFLAGQLVGRRAEMAQAKAVGSAKQ